MSLMTPAIYAGRVEHRRLTPVAHSLSYRVFALLLDAERMDATAKGLRLFSHNRFNLFSVYDRDHGARDGRPVGEHIRALIAQRPEARRVAHIFMLAYPRVLGFVFNPLTTYYLTDRGGQFVLMVYEVTNTFGDRVSYVIPADGISIDQSCPKQMWVSPFNGVQGQYGFHGHVPGETLSLGVSLKDSDGPKLKAWFRARRVALTDRELLAHFIRIPFLTFKVVAGIMWEAFKLKMRGLAYVPRPAPPSETVFHHPVSKENVP